MHEKERRKLEILLELRKYLSNDFIVAQIDKEISATTSIILKNKDEMIKLIIAVSKNSIYLETSDFFYADINKLAILCPSFKPIQQIQLKELAVFLNTYINYFSEQTIFDISHHILNLTTSKEINISSNYFFNKVIVEHQIVLTERKVFYFIHILLKTKKDINQNIIISSNGNGKINISVGVESQIVKQKIKTLSEKDYVSYFLYNYSFLFENSDLLINSNSTFDEIRQALSLIDMLSF